VIPDHGLGKFTHLWIFGFRERQMCIADIDQIRRVGDMRDL